MGPKGPWSTRWRLPRVWDSYQVRRSRRRDDPWAPGAHDQLGLWRFRIAKMLFMVPAAKDTINVLTTHLRLNGDGLAIDSLFLCKYSLN